MLMDKLREGAQGSIAKIIFWLIIFSFALAGVGSYLNRPVNTDPAEVNGEPITAQALEKAYGNERARLESQFGDSFSQLASNPAYVQKLRKSVLDKLVSDLVLDQQAFHAQIRVGDEQVKEAIRKMHLASTEFSAKMPKDSVLGQGRLFPRTEFDLRQD